MFIVIQSFIQNKCRFNSELNPKKNYLTNYFLFLYLSPFLRDYRDLGTMKWGIRDVR